MIVDQSNFLLFIEPKTVNPDYVYEDFEFATFCESVYNGEHKHFFEPLRLALKQAKWGIMGKEFELHGRYLGHHTCVCGAQSYGHDFLLPNGMVTNALCAHYILYHYAEIPRSELDKLDRLVQFMNNEPNACKFMYQRGQTKKTCCGDKAVKQERCEKHSRNITAPSQKLIKRKNK